MSIQSILIISLFYLINGPFCDLLEFLGVSLEWIGFIDYTILFILIVGLVFYKQGIKTLKFKPKNKSFAKYFVETILIMALSYLLVNLLVLLSDRVFDLSILPQNTELLKDKSNELPKWVTFIMMTIYAPFIEEFVFRHSMIAWPDKADKKTIAIMTVISILAFDFIHVIHIQEFLYYLPLSVALTLVYVKNDRQVSASIIAHSLTNFVAFILILLGDL